MNDRTAIERRSGAGPGPRPAAGLVEIERLGDVGVLTLSRPDQRNALSIAMLDAIGDAVGAFSADRGIRAVVVAARGPAFSAGHDLKELTAHRADADRGRAFFADTMQRCAAMMLAILRSPKPFIAAVEGPATAAGCQLVATCDLAVAGANATFATPGVDIGLFCSTPMVALSRNVPRKRAMEMLLLGDPVPAEAAAGYGLVNRVVPAGEALAVAKGLARLVAAKSPVTVAIGKEAYYRQIEQPVTEAYAYASEVMVRNMLARDAAEGIAAFIEKRPPEWMGE